MSGQHSNRETLLRETSQSFCSALLSPPPPNELIAKYFTSSNPRITEHGPLWANQRLPFLGKTFSGVSGCEEYFNVLSQTLKMHMSKDTFPDSSRFIVDARSVSSASGNSGSNGKGAVSVVGKAKFESVKTGKSWDEQFIYRLSDFDEEGKIGHWEIWADPLSAWDAVGSQEGEDDAMLVVDSGFVS